jgi:secondary thiamine-phosphate synthase enzyme
MSSRILTFQTKGNTDIVDITDKVIEVVKKEKVKEGVVNIFVKGSTAAVTTIEADDNLYEDLREVLEKLVPMGKNWRHHQTWGDDNGGSHLRAALFGPSVSIPVINNKLSLGTWQKIVLIDFDTSVRRREVIVTCCKS